MFQPLLLVYFCAKWNEKILWMLLQWPCWRQKISACCWRFLWQGGLILAAWCDANVLYLSEWRPGPLVAFAQMYVPLFHTFKASCLHHSQIYLASRTWRCSMSIQTCLYLRPRLCERMAQLSHSFCLSQPVTLTNMVSSRGHWGRANLPHLMHWKL